VLNRDRRTAFIQASDVYPLVLSIGITIQAIGFAVIQARGLDDLMIRGCTLISQFMLPSKFLNAAARSSRGPRPGDRADRATSQLSSSYHTYSSSSASRWRCGAWRRRPSRRGGSGR